MAGPVGTRATAVAADLGVRILTATAPTVNLPAAGGVCRSSESGRPAPGRLVAEGRSKRGSPRTRVDRPTLIWGSPYRPAVGPSSKRKTSPAR